MLTTYQMASPMYVLRNSVPWIAVLVPPSLLFAIFSGHGLLSVSITSLALLLITPMFLAFSKQKPAVTMKKSVTEEEEKEVADEAVMVEEKADQEDAINSSEVKEAETQKHPQSEDVNQIHGLHSENESVDDDHSSSFSEEEDSDADWPFSGNNSGHSPHFSSDCSISDEESLIELPLPSGHFLGLEKPDPKLQPPCLLHHKLFAPDSISQQHQQNGPSVDFFADINEEDNMIEIDISMGSIKCSRFEIIEA